jgi:hypothetical protein
VPAPGYRTYYLTKGALPAGNENIPSAVPAKETQAVLRIVLYRTVKRIDVEVDLNRFNGENRREFRIETFKIGTK